MNHKKVSLELTNSEALVLFDFLARFNECGDFEFEDQAEQTVLWDIESILEKSLSEPFLPNYDLLIKQAREAVRSVGTNSIDTS